MDCPGCWCRDSAYHPRCSLSMGSQAVIPVVDHCLRERNAATFELTTCPRQIRKTSIELERGKAGYGTPVLGDHDLPPLLYVVEKSSQVLTCFAYAGSSHDRHYVTCSTIQFPTRSRAIGVPYSSLPALTPSRVQNLCK